MITRKELKALIVKAECFGARVHVEQHVDHDGYFVVDSVRVTNAAGIGPHPMGMIGAAERLREFIAKQPAVQAGVA